MNRTIELKNALSALFRSGADREHDENELMDLLEDIDFRALLQGISDDTSPVYQYHAYGERRTDFEYYGPALLPSGSVSIYEDDTDCIDGEVSCTRTLELWLLPDLSFAVTSCFAVLLYDGSYETRYRTYQGRDWKKAGMTIDFLDLADNLEAMCVHPVKDRLPMYEF